MVWSAGQREFVPLLLGLYWLLPPTKVKRRGSIQWVIIEELEMGMHPRAIETILVMVLDLLEEALRKEARVYYFDLQTLRSAYPHDPKWDCAIGMAEGVANEQRPCVEAAPGALPVDCDGNGRV